MVRPAASAGTSVSSALREPGSRPAYMSAPITSVANTLTALVSTKISTERLAMRSTDRPRAAQHPGAERDAGEAADRDDRVDRELRERQARDQPAADHAEHEREQQHIACAREQLEADSAHHQAGLGVDDAVGRVAQARAPPAAARRRARRRSRGSAGCCAARAIARRSRRRRWQGPARAYPQKGHAPADRPDRAAAPRRVPPATPPYPVMAFALIS